MTGVGPPSLPETLENAQAVETIRLIDVLWLEPTTGRVAAAFEVEHTTSIYSGIIRMLDLALGLGQADQSLFLVAPNAHEAIARFGQGLKPIEAIARRLS